MMVKKTKNRESGKAHTPFPPKISIYVHCLRQAPDSQQCLDK